MILFISDAGHVVETFAATIISSTIPISLYLANNKRKAKLDVQKRHEENQKVLTDLAEREKYFPSHNHGEKTGPLCAENIIRPPNGK